MLNPHEISCLRKRFSIPSQYSDPIRFDRDTDLGKLYGHGGWLLTYMDATITILDNGTCTRTTMECSVYRGHYFHTTEWPQKGVENA